jgi:thiol-disulfide isomerase/thioredoxin
MSRNLRFVLLVAILICQKPQAQLSTKENPIPRQVQQISSVQDSPKKIKALSIGDRVPDFQLKLLNYSSPVANLSSFKGKLVILDFWASWCYSCLHAFPKLNELQKKFSGELQLILVNSESTGDKKEKVIQTVKKFSSGSLPLFLVSYNDNIAFQYFPHNYLPHYVWITPTGIVKAITEADEVTSENIKAILQNENVELSLPVKKDYFPNKLMDISLDGQPEIDENLAYYSIFKKGKISGLSKINALRETVANNGEGKSPRGISLRNVPFIELLETAVMYSKNGLNGDLRKRLILEIKDSSQIIFDPSKMNKEAWENDNLYTYDLVIPESEIRNIDEYILSDLNRYSGYTVKIERRALNCYWLSPTGNILMDPSRFGKGASITIKEGIYHIENASIESLTATLDKNPNIKFPVITKTTQNLKFDFSFNYEHLDLDSLRKQLLSVGLELKETVEPINVIVISKENHRID